MADQEKYPQAFEKPQRQKRDIPAIIKYILLILVLILLAAEYSSGEFTDISGKNWVVWLIIFIKLFLIALLITLIKVQRSVTCTLTKPTGCSEEEPDPAEGIYKVRVVGTANGAAFGSYVVEVRKVGYVSPIPGIVMYPGGGGGGVVPVINGELAEIDTTGLEDDAYEIKLIVYPSWGGTPKVCTIVFNLLKAIVYMNRFAGVPAISMSPVPDNPNPLDEAAELRTGTGPVAVGGTMAIKGAAYIYECENRKIAKYEMRYAQVTLPGTEPSQPVNGIPIPATWPVSNRFVLFEYTIPDHYKPWTRVGMAATDLVNSWRTMTVGLNTYYKLKPGRWNSAGAGSGRFSILLSAEDTTGVEFHDIQHVWLDNKPILGKIVRFEGWNEKTGTWEAVDTCQDIHISQYKKLRIMGLAWDPVIDEAWWPAVAPNDNFGHFNLKYKKQFQSYKDLTANISSRVPTLPATPPVITPVNADADVLTEWDLTSLDAGPAPSPGAIAPDSKLYDGESCTFTLRLFVTDTSVIPGIGHHEAWDFESLKIIND